jgi:hypothetical protein
MYRGKLLKIKGWLGGGRRSIEIQGLRKDLSLNRWRKGDGPLLGSLRLIGRHSCIREKPRVSKLDWLGELKCENS